MTLTAVELRQSVIDTAYNYFQLPQNDRLLVVANADDYLRAHEPGSFQIIFSDIFGADDVDDLQLQEHYLDQCCNNLSDDGWLALNCWQRHKEGSDTLEILRARFSHAGVCNTQAGNWVIIAARQYRTVDRNKLKAHAREWARRLGFSLPLTSLRDAAER